MANYMLNLVTFSKPSKEAIDLISNIDKWLPAPLFKEMTAAKLQNMLSSDSLLENYQNGLRKGSTTGLIFDFPRRFVWRRST